MTDRTSNERTLGEDLAEGHVASAQLDFVNHITPIVVRHAQEIFQTGYRAGLLAERRRQSEISGGRSEATVGAAASAGHVGESTRHAMGSPSPAAASGSSPETKAEPIDGRDRIEQCVREIQQICDWGNMDASEWLNDETAIGEKPRERPQPIATVIDNNQPGWTNIVETAPNVTLPVGTKLYDQNALLAVGARVVDEIWQRESSEKSEVPLTISKAPQS